MKGAISLPDLHVTEGKKGAFHYVLQLIFCLLAVGGG